jgi:DNA gyrase inhibitor GyrI
MTDLEVRIVTLEPMRVASAHGFGPSPEEIAWDKILTFARSKGLLDDLKAHRFFGFNNPSPSPGSPNYGYEQWITVGPEVEPEGDVTVKAFLGGLYAVARCEGLSHIGEVWDELCCWREDSQYRAAHHHWLEECLTSPGTPLEEMILDLYLPIVG